MLPIVFVTVSVTQFMIGESRFGRRGGSERATNMIKSLISGSPGRTSLPVRPPQRFDPCVVKGIQAQVVVDLRFAEELVLEMVSKLTVSRGPS